ncbi:MAG TPA: permease-like cell division protein FtsX [Polyangiaceae bacterium]|nr:permease-like cell division protein FtsX [Polyangiaceae bacterium]
MIDRVRRAIVADLRLHLLSVFSVAVAFVCLSATLLVAVNVESLRGGWAKSARASVYLRADADPEAVAAMRAALQRAAGVTEVKYVSAEQARQDVLGNTQDEALSALPEEAFPASLEVMLRDDAAQEQVKQLSAQLKALPAVESVETYAAWGKRLDKFLEGGAHAALLLVVIVLGSVVSVVGSTMRMALSRRSTEVEVLKMVGATDSYVRGPFVVEGAVQGGLGALLAIIIMGSVYMLLKDGFDGALGSLLGTTPHFLPATLCLALVALGAVIGAASAFASLRRLLGSYVTA